MVEIIMCIVIQGELTVTADMEALQESLYLDQVPKTWELRAYPSLFSLTTWFIDLLNRFKDLESWTSDFQLPYAVTLGKPSSSFLKI
jgi:dynein heavy chain